MRTATIPLAGVAVATLALLLAATRARAATPYAAGVRIVEYTAPDHRTLSMAVFYPARADANAAPLTLPFTTHVALLSAPPIADDHVRHPLIMLSHGRGSDPWQYAWLAQIFAAQGTIVAGAFHFRANSYDRDIAHLANLIWQRPVDLSLDITHLLTDPDWAPHIDAQRIGVMGHSQGGFTALWIGGAGVTADRFAALQRRFVANPLIPESIRRTLPVDPTPALHVADPRVKAAFAMAPGVVQAFGMDAQGLAQMHIPAFIAVGDADTQTPPPDN
ncbi:MAG TPA: hypothetical protein VME92_18335, partial [Acetobacteraceae bacterium]|nr:hypothetical protein [Acetobacteraceae bacterium]